MSLALFDFDGTITNKDSLFGFTIFCKGKLGFYLGLIVLSPVLVLLKMKLVSAKKAKEAFFSYFFRGTDINEFKSMCSEFCKSVVPSIIRSDALQKIEFHIENGHEVIIVTASSPYWVLPWASQFGISVIGTELDSNKGTISGKIRGNNCNGKEKLERIRKHVKLEEYEKVYAYGDTEGDKEMLSIADESYLKLFIG
ncbi:MAG: HAD-IB family hydrolase [Bacteroidota bacterium]